jgi:hypothetical protein
MSDESVKAFLLTQGLIVMAVCVYVLLASRYTSDRQRLGIFAGVVLMLGLAVLAVYKGWPT